MKKLQLKIMTVMRLNDTEKGNVAGGSEPDSTGVNPTCATHGESCAADCYTHYDYASCACVPK